MTNDADRAMTGGGTSGGSGGRDREREGPFWDIIAGRRHAPPAATLLGWELEAVDPDAGTIVVRFTAPEAFLEGELTDGEGAVIARATATARVLAPRP